MNCPKCSKEISAERLFCVWCESFVPAPEAGVKAGIFRRWLATAMDPGIAIVSYLIVAAILSSAASTDGGKMGVMAVVFVAYAIFYLALLAKGMTPGKYIVGERVVDKLTGREPGLGIMLLREIVGKVLSGIAFGLGFLWALFDKDNQAWHDKLAGTVVVKKR